jgi:3D (Asp-Asp-Asp) domain-containing protein
MFRYKLLAAAFSILIAFAEEFSLVKSESPAPKTENTKAEWPPKDAPKPEAITSATPEVKTITVSASVYFPEHNQTDSTPFITADGSRINKKNPGKQRWIAVSRDLHSRWGGEISYGDSLMVTGISEELDGYYIVKDVMNRRIRNRIDILVGRKDDIMGFWNNVQIARVENTLAANEL